MRKLLLIPILLAISNCKSCPVASEVESIPLPVFANDEARCYIQKTWPNAPYGYKKWLDDQAAQERLLRRRFNLKENLDPPVCQ